MLWIPKQCIFTILFHLCILHNARLFCSIHEIDFAVMLHILTYQQSAFTRKMLISDIPGICMCNDMIYATANAFILFERKPSRVIRADRLGSCNRFCLSHLAVLAIAAVFIAAVFKSRRRPPRRLSVRMIILQADDQNGSSNLFGYWKSATSRKLKTFHTILIIYGEQSVCDNVLYCICSQDSAETFITCGATTVSSHQFVTMCRLRTP